MNDAEEERRKQMAEAGQRLLAYIGTLQRDGLNKSAIERGTGVRRQTLVDWANGVATPELDTLAKIAVMLRASLAEMVEVYDMPIGGHNPRRIGLPANPGLEYWQEMDRRLASAAGRVREVTPASPPQPRSRTRRKPPQRQDQ